jgi:hypothetical protein
MNNTLDQVVSDAVLFLRSLTDHYGPDRGMDVWNAMGDAMGKELKGKVFFSMLTDNSPGRVRFSIDAMKTGHGQHPSNTWNNGNVGAPAPNAVSCIKAIRAAAGSGLKEAKDLYDASKIHDVQIDCLTVDAGRKLAKELRDLGCRVH